MRNLCAVSKVGTFGCFRRLPDVERIVLLLFCADVTLGSGVRGVVDQGKPVTGLPEW
ncbi:hypothetical protein IWQ51_003064 [Labrenzia sp. EL_142]|nr:hypothetical protein [Labrenzia sp. EL_142]